MTPREIKRLNTPANLDDSGRLKATGERPGDWYRAAQRVGSDRQ